MAHIHNFKSARSQSPRRPNSGDDARAVRIDLTDADMDAWRNAVVFGTGAQYAYTPDPEITPPVEPVAALPADAPSPIVWHRQPDRTVQAVRLGLIAAAVVLAFAQISTWMAA